MQPGQQLQIQLAPQPQVMSARARRARHHESRRSTERVRPEIIPLATFAGTKPGYAFIVGAFGKGFCFEVAAAAGEKSLVDANLHSVANMAGMWGDFGSQCFDGTLSCCIKPILWVTPFPHEDADSFLTQSMGRCALNWPCCDAHGIVPPNAAPRRYVRTPGTNTFQSTGSHRCCDCCGSHRCCDCCPPQPDQHTAVLLGERRMTVDGKMYNWGPSWVAW